MIYVYKCKECGHLTEKMRPVAQLDDPVKCEKCQAEATRTPTAGALKFGQGFFNTGGY